MREDLKLSSAFRSNQVILLVFVSLFIVFFAILAFFVPVANFGFNTSNSVLYGDSLLDYIIASFIPGDGGKTINLVNNFQGNEYTLNFYFITSLCYAVYAIYELYILLKALLSNDSLENVCYTSTLGAILGIVLVLTKQFMRNSMIVMPSILDYSFVLFLISLIYTVAVWYLYIINNKEIENVYKRRTRFINSLFGVNDISEEDEEQLQKKEFVMDEPTPEYTQNMTFNKSDFSELDTLFQDDSLDQHNVKKKELDEKQVEKYLFGRSLEQENQQNYTRLYDEDTINSKHVVPNEFIIDDKAPVKQKEKPIKSIKEKKPTKKGSVIQRVAPREIDYKVPMMRSQDRPSQPQLTKLEEDFTISLAPHEEFVIQFHESNDELDNSVLNQNNSIESLNQNNEMEFNEGSSSIMDEVNLEETFENLKDIEAKQEIEPVATTIDEEEDFSSWLERQMRDLPDE